MTKIKVITSLQKSEQVVKSLLCLDKPVIGVSCKGTDVGPKGRLTQITVCTCDGDIFIFDVRRQPKIILDGAVIRLFQSRELVKVLHDCRDYSLTLKKTYGVDLNNYFDVQVAYGVVLEQQGFPSRKLSLSTICQRYGIESVIPDRELQMKMADVNFWALRPLSEDMTQISASEVLPLIPLYHHITQNMSPEMIKWFECQSLDSKFFNPSKPEPVPVMCERFERRLKVYSDD